MYSIVSMLNSKQIEIFYHIYKEGSITKAAKMLNVSQPALSKSISYTEKKLGFKLFNRDSKKLLPTYEADELYEYASMVIFQLESFNKTAEKLTPLDSKDINIGTTPSIMLTLMPRILKAYKEIGIAGFNFINLNSNELLSRLDNKSLDIVICFDPAISNRGSNHLDASIFSRHIIHKGSHVMISPKGFYDNKAASKLEHFLNDPFIEITNLISFYGVNSLTKHFSNQPIRNIAGKVSSYSGAASLVSLGVGSALVDSYTANNCDKSKVDVFEIEEDLPYQIVLLNNQSKAISEESKKFLEFVKTLTNKI
jgi:DNA-binding transcriptional LysR family regulator